MPDITPSYVNCSVNELEEYLSVHATPELPVLYELYRATHLRTVNPRMLSGHIQGNFLRFMVQLTQSSRILEIGTFTGYSAICMASAMPEGGVLHTFEVNDELESVAREFFAKAGLKDKIQMHIGDALKLAPALGETFDMVFMDGDKQEYVAYYKMCMKLLQPGGILLADNVLWSGKVLDLEKNNDKSTIAVEKFNQMVTDDTLSENFILPLRDGIMCVRKK
jgi:caffeoyl-CoA O-methyltransferase